MTELLRPLSKQAVCCCGTVLSRLLVYAIVSCVCLFMPISLTSACLCYCLLRLFGCDIYLFYLCSSGALFASACLCRSLLMMLAYAIISYICVFMPFSLIYVCLLMPLSLMSACFYDIFVSRLLVFAIISCVCLPVPFSRYV